MKTEVQQKTNNKPQPLTSIEETRNLVKGGTGLIYVITSEERRFISNLVEQVAKPLGKDVILWSSWQGLVKYGTEEEIDRATGDWDKSWNPSLALKMIRDYKPTRKASKGTIFVMRDMHTVMTDVIPRQMRDILPTLFDRETSKTIIVTAPELGYGGPTGSRSPGLPAVLEKDMVVVDFDLMNREQLKSNIESVVTARIESCKKKEEPFEQYQLDDTQLEEVSKALQGLTEPEYEQAVASSIIQHNRLDVDTLQHEKRRLVRKSGILEFVETRPSMDDVGGLDELKKFVDRYKRAMTPEAAKFGVEPLKGILLVGIPGSGKSLSAKAISSAWKLPLLKLDIGKIFGSLVGRSEENMRSAIKTAESCKPCVLYIDEIEKGLSGTKSSSATDGGTTSRVFGTLLTAMQEGLKDVVIVASANAIDQLPPELIRRFSEVFYVDLPVDEEREAIFRIHLRAKNRDPNNFDLKKLVELSKNYTGAEIEKAIKEALATAFEADRPDVTTKDIEQSIQETKPLFQVMKESITKVRKWAKDRARYASSLALKAAQTGTSEIKLDLDELDKDIAASRKAKKEKKSTGSTDKLAALEGNTEETNKE